MLNNKDRSVNDFIGQASVPQRSRIEMLEKSKRC